MLDVEQTLFTTGVFADAVWAERGIEALKRGGFPPEALSIMAREGDEASRLVVNTRRDLQKVDVKGVGKVVACGDLIRALGGPAGLARVGLAGSFRRVGYQAHDGLIFQTLTARGGVLVAVESVGRSADALALLHSYGAGNAAIGAWAGRV